MNTFSIVFFIVVVAVFGGIIYVTQRNTASKQAIVPSPAMSIPSPSGYMPLAAQDLAMSQQKQAPQTTAVQPSIGVAEQPRASYSALLKTSRGNISLTLYADKAPNTVKNFIDKAQSGYYNGLIFHRVEDWVIQGGDPLGKGYGGGQMPTEMNDLPFVKGSLGVARGQDIRISNDSQFFITKSDASWLNNQYTNFGIVTDGMDVVDKIQIGDKILGITIK